MSDKRIIDLETKQAIGSGDYVAIDSAEGTYKADANTNIITPLTNVRNNVANSSASPDKYSSSTAYKVGNIVIQDDIIYICTTPCSAASWAVNSACFAATTLASVVTQLNEDLKYIKVPAGTYYVDGIIAQQGNAANYFMTCHFPFFLNNENNGITITCEEFRPSGQTAVKDTSPSISALSFSVNVYTSNSQFSSYVGKLGTAKITISYS